MKYRLIIFILLLTACASPAIQHAPKGSLTWDVGFEPEQLEICKEGKVIYRQITISTNWMNGHQCLEYSWQCYVSDQNNKRHYVLLGSSVEFEDVRYDTNERKRN